MLCYVASQKYSILNKLSSSHSHTAIACTERFEYKNSSMYIEMLQFIADHH